LSSICEKDKAERKPTKTDTATIEGVFRNFNLERLFDSVFFF